MDLDSFLVAMYVMVDDWPRDYGAHAPRHPRRPTTLSESEVLTLAVVAQWPRWRSQRDFWRFARAHLRAYFPALGSQSQFNRRGCAPRSRPCALCTLYWPRPSRPHKACTTCSTRR